MPARRVPEWMNVGISSRPLSAPPGCMRGTHYRTTMTLALRRDARPIHPAASSVIHSPPTWDAGSLALRRAPRLLGRPRARAFGLARGGGRGLRLRAALRPQPLRGEARPFGERVELCPHDALMHLVRARERRKAAV